MSLLEGHLADRAIRDVLPPKVKRARKRRPTDMTCPLMIDGVCTGKCCRLQNVYQWKISDNGSIIAVSGHPVQVGGFVQMWARGNFNLKTWGVYYTARRGFYVARHHAGSDLPNDAAAIRTARSTFELARATGHEVGKDYVG